MKVVLYYPPLVFPSAEMPYPSVPILTSYLKENTLHEIIGKDINIDLINKLVAYAHSHSLKPISHPGNGKLTKAEIATNLVNSRRTRNRTLIDIAHYMINRLRFKPYRKGDWFAHMVREARKHKKMGRIEVDALSALNEILSRNDSPVPNYLLDYWNLSYEQIDSILSKEGPDILVEFLGKDYFKELECDGKLIVGFSVAFFTQFGMAIALAKYIRTIHPDVFILIGGAVIRHVSRNLKKAPHLFEVVDCFVETEGEEILTNISDLIEQDKNWRTVPGIYYRSAKKNIVNNPPVQFDIRKNGVPDYGLIEKHDYLNPGNLYLRTSIGCYWDKCTFCTQSFNKYKQRSVSQIVDDMTSLSEQYGVHLIYFSDEAVALRKLEKIADLILDKRLLLYWTSYSRFDKAITEKLCKKLLQAGCERLRFGLESGNQRVNNLMCKGVNLEDVTKSLSVFQKFSFRCWLGAIMEFPGETPQERQDTVDLLSKYQHVWLNYSIGTFNLEYGSHIYNNPEVYNLSDIEKADGFFYKNCYQYERIE